MKNMEHKKPPHEKAPILIFRALAMSALSTLLVSNGDRVLAQESSPTLPVVVWERVFDTYQEIVDVRVTRDGHIIALGNARDDIKLLKLSDTGEVVWERTYGGDGDDFGTSVMQTHDDGYIIAGYTDSFPKEDDTSGEPDIYLLRTDASGELEWETTYGQPGEDRATFVHQKTDGSFALIGTTEYTSPSTLAIVKFDDKGEFQEKMNYIGRVDSGAPDAIGAPVSGGGYYLYSNETREIQKIRTDGTVEFRRDFPEDMATVLSIIEVPEDAYAVTTAGTPYIPNTNLIFFNQDGTERWRIELRLPQGMGKPRQARYMEDDGFLVGGIPAGISDSGPSNLLKTDAKGLVQWRLYLGTEGGNMKRAHIFSVVKVNELTCFVVGRQVESTGVGFPLLTRGYAARVDIGIKTSVRPAAEEYE